MNINREFSYSDTLRIAAMESTTGLSRKSRERKNYEDSFFGTKSFEDAMYLAENGWPEGLEKLAGKLSVLSSRLMGDGTRRKLHYDVRGRGVDVGRYLAGRPDCFKNLRRVHETETGNQVELVVALGALGSVSYERILWRGAAILLLTEVLEASGYFTTITGVATVESHSGSYWEASIGLKSASNYMEKDRLAFVLAHASFARRILFGVKEMEPVNVVRAFDFYDRYSRSVPPRMVPSSSQLIVPTPDEMDVYGENSAIQWVIASLAKFGVEAGV